VRIQAQWPEEGGGYDPLWLSVPCPDVLWQQILPGIASALATEEAKPNKGDCNKVCALSSLRFIIKTFISGMAALSDTDKFGSTGWIYDKAPFNSPEFAQYASDLKGEIKSRKESASSAAMATLEAEKDRPIVGAILSLLTASGIPACAVTTASPNMSLLTPVRRSAIALLDNANANARRVLALPRRRSATEFTDREPIIAHEAAASGNRSSSSSSNTTSIVGYNAIACSQSSTSVVAPLHLPWISHSTSWALNPAGLASKGLIPAQAAYYDWASAVRSCSTMKHIAAEYLGNNSIFGSKLLEQHFGERKGTISQGCSWRGKKTRVSEHSLTNFWGQMEPIYEIIDQAEPGAHEVISGLQARIDSYQRGTFKNSLKLLSSELKRERDPAGFEVRSKRAAEVRTIGAATAKKLKLSASLQKTGHTDNITLFYRDGLTRIEDTEM
jgi:hypothetical protein